jgi:hypothetical protein
VRPVGGIAEPVLVEGGNASLTQPQRKVPMSELDLVVNALIELDPKLDARVVRIVGETEGVEKLKDALRSLRLCESMRSSNEPPTKEE